MNEQLQAKLIEILTQIQAATKAAGDFALEQLPDIALQYIMYGRAMHTFGFSLGIIAFIVFIINTIIVMRKDKQYLDATTNFIIAIISMLSSLVLLGINTSQFMLVWFAPKVWLLTEITRLLK